VEVIFGVGAIDGWRPASTSSRREERMEMKRDKRRE